MRAPFHLIVLLLIGTFVSTGCDSTEPSSEGPGEEELIDRVVVSLVNAADPNDVIVASAENTEGLNGAPSINVDPLTLAAGATYNGTISFFNTQEDEDITAEVEEEAEEHQVFYTVSGLSGVAFTVTDRESDYVANGGSDLPVGLAFTVVVANGATGSGEVRIQLAHYDEAPKDGTSVSDETDVDFAMPITIQ